MITEVRDNYISIEEFILGIRKALNEYEASHLYDFNGYENLRILMNRRTLYALKAYNNGLLFNPMNIYNDGTNLIFGVKIEEDQNLQDGDFYIAKKVTEDAKNELKRCPFCGGMPKLYSEKDPELHGFFHTCENEFDDAMVKIESRFFPTEEQAIAAWNRRV